MVWMGAGQDIRMVKVGEDMGRPGQEIGMGPSLDMDTVRVGPRQNMDTVRVSTEDIHMVRAGTGQDMVDVIREGVCHNTGWAHMYETRQEDDEVLR